MYNSMFHRLVRLFLPALTMVLLAFACHSDHSRTTRVVVYNQGMDSLKVADMWIHRGWSEAYYVAHGDTDSLALSRPGRSLGELVIYSLVAKSDPDKYDAAINVHEDSLDHLFLREYSPYIDAVVIAGP